jgi:hypothetical protein
LNRLKPALELEQLQGPGVLDVLSSVAVFVAPPALVFLYLIWREVRRLGRERRACQTEAEATAAEGFPPPGPPTTDSLDP